MYEAYWREGRSHESRTISRILILLPTLVGRLDTILCFIALKLAIAEGPQSLEILKPPG